jgi:hypothetical protein
MRRDSNEIRAVRVWCGPLAPLLFSLSLVFLLPTGVTAQLGAVEAFARRVTDVSFYVNTGGLYPSSSTLQTGGAGLAAYGLELLFSIGEVSKPLPGVSQSKGDTVSVEWIQTTLTQHDDHTDTTNVYEVKPLKRSVPSETIWLFEMGLGYGQVTGFSGSDQNTELRGTIRDLPSVSFYASYEPLGGYFGFRSGFIRVQGLQYYDETGGSYSGKAESFLAAGMVGYAKEFLGFNLFLESGYSLRHFPSIVWSGGPLPSGIPKELNMSGWFLGTGIQFAIAG